MTLPMTKGMAQIRCQRCRAANPFGEELCAKCGTRLMLVVEPTKLRYEEESGAVSPQEQYLVERLTLVENNLLRLADKVERGLDLLLRQAKLTHAEHLLMETLLAALEEVGIVQQKQILKTWHIACESDDVSVQGDEAIAAQLAAILESMDAEQRVACEPLLREGLLQVAAGRRREGLRLLERAAAHAVESGPLNLLLGIEHFRRRKMELARAYLERAVRIEISDAGAALLLGLVVGEMGNIVEAKRLLQRAVKVLKKTFAGSYALGRLHASEGRWESAQVEFKRALSARPCAEANFAVGLACYLLGREKLAWRYISQALSEDTKYPVALFLAGLIQMRLGSPPKARELFSLAQAFGLDAPRISAAKLRDSRVADDFIVVAFLGAERDIGKGVMFAGDERLAAVLVTDALESVTAR